MLIFHGGRRSVAGDTTLGLHMPLVGGGSGGESPPPESGGGGDGDVVMGDPRFLWRPVRRFVLGMLGLQRR
jgi:hypothetical protein